MVYELVITKTALGDLKAAIEWYNKKDKAIRLRLINNFEISIEKLKRTPKIYTLLKKNVRGIEISKFPYRVFYYLSANYEAIIIGVVHGKRSDAFIKKN
ncbi:MAG: type II toxin-antitoxin system RelE/ParE family toxin [Ferruginibacter sp.]